MADYVTAGPGSLRNWRLKRVLGRDYALAYWLIAPSILVLLGLIAFPFIRAIMLAFYSQPIGGEGRFIGLENYLYLWTDEEFWTSFWLGTVYSFWTIVFQLILGVGAALILNESFLGRGLVRGIVLFPYMIPTIVAVILWKWLLNDTYGVVNYWLLALGIVRDPISFLGTDHIMLSTIVMSVWQFFPFVLLSVLARLQTIPEELYEAAEVDGSRGCERDRAARRHSSGRLSSCGGRGHSCCC